MIELQKILAIVNSKEFDAEVTKEQYTNGFETYSKVLKKREFMFSDMVAAFDLCN